MAEFEDMFQWHQTHTESPFTNHTVFTVARPWGRSTLTQRYRVETRGAHTTRHETEQSIGIEHVLWIVKATLSSPFSAWSKLVQVDSERFARSASAGTQIEMARAYVAHRAQQVARMTDLR